MELKIDFASTRLFMNLSLNDDIDYYDVYCKLKKDLPYMSFRFYRYDKNILGEHFCYSNIYVNIYSLSDIYKLIDYFNCDIVLTSDNGIIVYNDYLE